MPRILNSATPCAVLKGLARLACAFLILSVAACFVPKYEKYFEPSAEGARLASTYCADSRHGPPALAEFVNHSVPIVVSAYPAPEEAATIVIRMGVVLSEGQALSFDPKGVRVIDLAANRRLEVRPDHWSRHFFGVAESHAIETPLNIVGQPHFTGGLDRVVVFWTMASDGNKHFSVDFPQLIIGGVGLKIPVIVFTEKSGVFALPVFGNC